MEESLINDIRTMFDIIDNFLPPIPAESRVDLEIAYQRIKQIVSDPVALNDAREDFYELLLNDRLLQMLHIAAGYRQILQCIEDAPNHAGQEDAPNHADQEIAKKNLYALIQ